MKKNFIKGFILGGILFGFTSVLASEVVYNAFTAGFPILINGQKWESEKPALVVDGSTYLPLKAIGEVLDVKVNWNSELRQVEIGETLSEEEKFSRKNPAPIGTAQSINISNYFENYKATVTVEESIRGSKAWKKIKEANMFNDEAQEGYEYILAKIRVSVDKTKDDKSVSVSGYDFECYSTDNTEYDSSFAVAPEPRLSSTLYEGGSTTGYVVFKVKTTDIAPKIVYGKEYDGTGGIWFGL